MLGETARNEADSTEKASVISVDKKEKARTLTGNEITRVRFTYYTEVCQRVWKSTGVLEPLQRVMAEHEK